MPPPPVMHTRLHILSATYGPAEGRKLLDGKLVDYNRKETCVPYTRDVLPFLRALVGLAGEEDGADFAGDDFDYLDDVIGGDIVAQAADGGSGEAVVRGMQPTTGSPATRNAFALMDGRPMNAVFGDPCPGTTKLLRVEYLFCDYFYEEAVESIEGTGGSRVRKVFHCTTSRTFHSTFREHERVLLKRQDPLFRLEIGGTGELAGAASSLAVPLLVSVDDAHLAEELKEHVKPSQGVCENGMRVGDAPGMVPMATARTPQSSSSSLSHIQPCPQRHSTPSSSSSPSKKWKLAPSTSEITLPIVLPFLTVRQRAKCQLVCSSWRDIVLERGVAVVVDVNDVGLFPKDRMNFAHVAGIPRPTSRAALRIGDFLSTNGSSTSSNSPAPMQNHPSRSILRGLLNHSHSSLESLVLNDYLPLQPVEDLHPALPHLRKLKRLDISRIPSVTDETLQLISTCIGEGLEVLYIKGLKNITNDGVVRLVQSCRNLRVLDVSEVHQLDDAAGIAISGLSKLEVLNTKDNYKLTNRSVDLITKKCRRLVQATLWGCIRLTRVCFDDTQAAENDATTSNEACADASEQTSSMPRAMSLASLPAEPTKLVLLNLWGCHSLTDDAVERIGALPLLRSLCVSECHRLTDRFVSGIAHSLPQLLHLRLRYLRRITDASLESIGPRMSGLYSLDVSFCTKLTIGGLSQLIAERWTSLVELRLYSCRQLDVEGGSFAIGGNGGNGIGGGRQIVQALRNVRDVGILSFLDLRECQVHEPFARDEVFLSGMAELGFVETIHLMFVRPARWNREVKRQLRTSLSQAG